MTRASWLPLGPVALLVVLRVLQLHHVEPLLYSPELYGLAALAQDRAAGVLPAGRGPAEFVAAYQYGHFAQGTLLVQGLVAAFGLGSFHFVAIGFEAVTVLLAGALAQRIGGPRGLALGLLPWLLPPAFVVGWQLMPYGNHTEFLGFGLALGLLLLQPMASWRPRRWAGAVALLAVGFVLYRLNAVLFVGFAATALAQGSRRGLLATAAAGALAGGVLVGLWAAWPGTSADETLLSLVAPRAAPRSFGEAGFAPGWVWSQWGAPRGFAGGLAWPLGIAVAAGAGLAGVRASEELRGIGAFAAGWATAGILAPLLWAPPHAEYLLPGLYGILVLTLLGTSPSAPSRVRSVVGVGIAVAALAGIVDGARLLGPGPVGYDGPGFERALAVENLDGDEVPYFADLLQGGRGDRWVGRATATWKVGCLPQPLRHATPELPAPAASRCDGWPPGTLGAHIASRGELPHPPELRSIGRGAWIVCQRDTDRVRAAAQGLPPAAMEEIVRGARAEEVQTGVGR